MEKKPVTYSNFSKFIKVLAPQILSMIAQMLLKNIGGFKFWILKVILKYGGRAVIEAISEALFQHDRSVQQEEAKKKLEEVKADPTKTDQEIGDAYEDYYNSGRGTKP